MERGVLWALPAAFLAAGLSAEPPQMRLSALTGQQRLGTVVEVVDGEAVYESDIHATVWASAGGAFTYLSEGNRLRIGSVPGKGPVQVDWAGTRLHLVDGGRVALIEGGIVEVESAGVGIAGGSELSAGERLTVAASGRPGMGLRPGDSMSLDVPEKRPFALASAEPVAEPTFDPLPDVETPVRNAKLQTVKKPVPTLLARAERTGPEPLSATEQEEMRMAVGQAPSVPLQTVQPPPPRFMVEGVPPTGTLAGEEAPKPPGRLTKNQWGLVALITATAALIGLEAYRRQDD